MPPHYGELNAKGTANAILADLNGGDAPELGVITCQNYGTIANSVGAALRVYNNGGDGAFSSYQEYDPGTIVCDVVATLVNRDGRLDLAAADLPSNAVNLFLNTSR